MGRKLIMGQVMLCAGDFLVIGSICMMILVLRNRILGGTLLATGSTIKFTTLVVTE
jgi:hypothetical protein